MTPSLVIHLQGPSHDKIRRVSDSGSNVMTIKQNDVNLSNVSMLFS